jgi:hypothetical protein
MNATEPTVEDAALRDALLPKLLSGAVRGVRGRQDYGGQEGGSNSSMSVNRKMKRKNTMITSMTMTTRMTMKMPMTMMMVIITTTHAVVDTEYNSVV